MSTQEMLVMGLLFIVLLAIQIIILKSLNRSNENTSEFDTNQFNDMANKALANNNEQFLALAKERFERQQSDAESQLDIRKKRLKICFNPYHSK